MMTEAILDTTFLIDLQRSHRNARNQQAIAWLKKNPNVILKIPSIVLGEFSAGFSDPSAPEIVTLEHQHEILEVGVGAAKKYGRIYRSMKENGNLIGGNDLWVAAIALEENLPLVTRNVADFERVDGLTVESY